MEQDFKSLLGLLSPIEDFSELYCLGQDLMSYLELSVLLRTSGPFHNDVYALYLFRT